MAEQALKPAPRHLGLTPEQLEMRSHGIGGSEIAAIAGLSPWAGPLDVYLSKTGQVEFDDSNFNVKRGRHMEGGITTWFEEDTGLIVRQSTTIVHPNYDIIMATPDGVVSDGMTDLGAFEAKSPARTDDHWGEPGTDEIPAYYVPQVQFEMAVLELDHAWIAAPIWGELKIYEMDFDPQLFDSLVGLAYRFWENHIVPHIPPDFSTSKTAIEYVKKQFPAAQTKELALSSDEVDRLAYQYHVLDYIEKHAKDSKGLLKARLIQEIGSDAGITGPFGKIRYSNTKGKSKIDWEALARHKGATDEDVAMFTSQAAGHRTFRPYWANKEPAGIAELLQPMEHLQLPAPDDED